MSANDTSQTRVCEGGGMREETRQVMVGPGWESEVMDDRGPRGVRIQRE